MVDVSLLDRHGKQKFAGEDVATLNKALSELRRGVNNQQ